MLWIKSDFMLYLKLDILYDFIETKDVSDMEFVLCHNWSEKFHEGLVYRKNTISEEVEEILQIESASTY